MQKLESQFVRLREEMLLYGLRPNAATHAAMCEGYIKLGDVDSALGSLQVGVVWAGGPPARRNLRQATPLCSHPPAAPPAPPRAAPGK